MGMDSWLTQGYSASYVAVFDKIMERCVCFESIYRLKIGGERGILGGGLIFSRVCDL